MTRHLHRIAAAPTAIRARYDDCYDDVEAQRPLSNDNDDDDDDDEEEWWASSSHFVDDDYSQARIITSEELFSLIFKATRFAGGGNLICDRIASCMHAGLDSPSVEQNPDDALHAVHLPTLIATIGRGSDADDIGACLVLDTMHLLPNARTTWLGCDVVDVRRIEHNALANVPLVITIDEPLPWRRLPRYFDTVSASGCMQQIAAAATMRPLEAEDLCFMTMLTHARREHPAHDLDGALAAFDGTYRADAPMHETFYRTRALDFFVAGLEKTDSLRRAWTDRRLRHFVRLDDAAMASRWRQELVRIAQRGMDTRHWMLNLRAYSAVDMPLEIGAVYALQVVVYFVTL